MRKKRAYAEAILSYTECIRKAKLCPTGYCEVLKLFLFELKSLKLGLVVTKALETWMWCSDDVAFTLYFDCSSGSWCCWKDFCAAVAKCLARRNSNTSFHQQLNLFKTRGSGVFSDAVAMEIVQVWEIVLWVEVTDFSRSLVFKSSWRRGCFALCGEESAFGRADTHPSTRRHIAWMLKGHGSAETFCRTC